MHEVNRLNPRSMGFSRSHTIKGDKKNTIDKLRHFSSLGFQKTELCKYMYSWFRLSVFQKVMNIFSEKWKGEMTKLYLWRQLGKKRKFQKFEMVDFEGQLMLRTNYRWR